MKTGERNGDNNLSADFGGGFSEMSSFESPKQDLSGPSDEYVIVNCSMKWSLYSNFCIQ
jgi:hypothetical protein